MIPSVVYGTAADETALAVAIQTLAAANGFTVTAAGTTPANSRWFQSSGEDGCSNIVFGIIPDAVARTMRAFTAADLDTAAVVSASVGGYTNNDSVAAATRVQAQTSLSWAARDNPSSSYTYAIVANRDGVSGMVVYVSGGVAAQGFFCFGKTAAVSGRFFQTQAKARIATVGAGSIGAQRLVTLDRNITAMLKDTGAGGLTYPNDPTQQLLFFQCVAGTGADFAQVGRRQIVPGTLATVGGVTRFEINVAQASSKLFGAGQRYANNNGANDIVRMMAEPTIAICGAATANTQPFAGTATCLAAWDGYGGQGSAITFLLANENTTDTASETPDPLVNRAPYYNMYALINVAVTALPAETNSESYKNIGRIPHAILLPNMSQGNFAFFRIDSNAARRFRVLSKGLTGLGLPSAINGGGSGTSQGYAVGPGW